MFFNSNSGISVRGCRSLFLCASIASFFAFAMPAAHAGESGLRGWAFCTTYAPYSTAYVAGDPVYASDVFYQDGTKDVELLWRNFLKQKYGWTKNAGCSIATANDGQASQLRDSARFMEQAGPKLVRTGWKAGTTSATTSAAPAPAPAQTSSPQAPAGSPSAPAQGSYMAGGIMYWVCTWFNTPSAVYISNAFSASNKLGPTELVPPFQKFVISRYPVNPHAGSANCIYKMKEADAQTYLQQRIAQPPSGMHVVQTGWKYGMTGSGEAAPAAHAAAAPPVATGPAAEAPAPAPAQGAPAPPATANIVVRLVDLVNSSTDPPGKRYRGVVSQSVTAGSVQIPQNTLAAIMLAQSSPGQWTAQLVSLKLNGQDVAVTSTAVQAASTMQQAAQKLGGLISAFGHKSNQAAQTVKAAGNKVMLPAGTSLTFNTTVPQPAAPAGNAAPMPSSPPPMQAQAAPAAALAGQPHGEIGPGGVVIGGSETV
jgi:hypothetical protein